jgi:TrmH family RNA methyltransferase
MIPFYKLDKLPRTQKLRKIAKMFSFAENRFNLAAEKSISIYSTAEFVFFLDALNLLADDVFFTSDAKRLFLEAAGIFKQTLTCIVEKKQDSNILNGMFLRALNNVKHLLLAETGRDQADWDFTGSDGKLDPAGRQVFEGMCVYMEDIRSPFNVGAMFRTAESFGVEKITLSPFCADPNHRRAQRTAMGCVDIIPWERQDFFDEVKIQTEFPFPIFALETGGIPITDFSFPHKGLLIVGSEELGVSPRALAAADLSLGRVSIPCYGVKASLNVSVAFGIAVQAWVKFLAD